MEEIAPDFTSDMLMQYVGGDPSDEDFITQCANAARQRVSDYIGSHQVPADVLVAALCEVGANLFQRRQSMKDSAMLAEGDMSPSFYRPALDPLTPARAMLKPYLGAPIA